MPKNATKGRSGATLQEMLSKIQNQHRIRQEKNPKHTDQITM